RRYWRRCLPSPERESSILATLKKKKPSALRDGQIEDSKVQKEGKMTNGTEMQGKAMPGSSPPQVQSPVGGGRGLDLLGLETRRSRHRVCDVSASRSRQQPSCSTYSARPFGPQFAPERASLRSRRAAARARARRRISPAGGEQENFTGREHVGTIRKSCSDVGGRARHAVGERRGEGREPGV
ncbi:PREDICTED: uncharacterized protein LOC106805082, partial [Priapulus caudatus]|uniref:Uncharacterized protein LOC106805082 n=1 Tax=Priapulus caudatus TaxID=37621 RepID=A0ABM1DQ26_PRICU